MLKLNKKEKNMSDKEFFGIWDISNEEWTKESKINYSYNDQLELLGDFVKKGRYDKAKKELFKYYKEKCNSDEKLNKMRLGEKKNQSKFLLDIMSEGIYSTINPLTSEKISQNKSWNTFSLDNFVRNKLENNVYKISFMLMSRYKGDKKAKFNSKEADTNPPVLEISVDGEKKEFTAVSDTYIRAGKHSNENFGKEKQLLVRDSGIPVDDNNMRTYIQFNIEGLNSDTNIDSAKLKLFGKADTKKDDMEILLFESEIPTVEENNKTWLNSTIKVYSWNKCEDKFEWYDQPGADNQWLNIISRFWRQMGFIGAYENTGKEKYAKIFLDFVSNFINNTGAGELLKDPNNRSRDYFLNIACRLEDISEAYFALVNSKYMNHEINTEILKLFWTETEVLNHPDSFWNGHEKNDNHGMVQTMSQTKIITLFPEFKKSKKWLREIKLKMQHMVDHFILDDGAYIEATNGYPEGILENLLFYKELMKTNNESLPDNFDNKLIKFARFFMNCLEPNWWLTEYGDDYYDNTDKTLKNLYKIGKLYDDQELIFVGSKGDEGKKPSHTSIYYPEGKLAIQRSEWNKNKDSLFLFTNVRPNVTHCHNDDLHINLYAYGRRLLVDTSKKSYNDEKIANWQRRSRGSHNVVDVDKKTVYIHWSKKTDKLEGNGNMVSNKFFDLFTGYHQEDWSDNEVMKQTRNILFLKPAGFWIVSDYVMVPSGEHDFYQNWHFDSKAEIAIEEKNKKSYSRYKQGSNLLIVPAEPEAITAKIESGFIASKPHKYITYQKQANNDITYNTILYPFCGKVDKSKIEVNRINLDVPLTTATCLKVEIKESDNEATGYYYHNYKAISEKKEFAEFETDAPTAYIQKNSEHINMLSLYSASYLKFKGKIMIKASKDLDNIAMRCNEGVLKISSSGNSLEDKGDIMIYVQDKIGQVIYNGQSINFNQKGDYLFL